MKKVFTALCLVMCFSSCKTGDVESNTAAGGDLKLSQVNDQVIVQYNFNNTGVDIRLEDMGVTIPGVSEMYQVEAKNTDNSVVLEGIVQVDTDTSGNRTVSLYQTGDDLADDVFIGAYVVDENMKVINVIVDENYQFSDPANPQPGSWSSNWDCVRRNYRAMKAAYESRPLDDLFCSIGSMGFLCRMLVLVSAGVECDKEYYIDDGTNHQGEIVPNIDYIENGNN